MSPPRSCLGLERIKDAWQVQMSGGKAARGHEHERNLKLQGMRKVLEKKNHFELLAGNYELFAQIISDSGRHVALRRTSKATSAAVRQAGKHEKVHYVVDPAKFNASTNPSKVGDLLRDLGATCVEYDVVEIKMDGLRYRPYGQEVGNNLNEIAPVLQTCAGLTSLSLSNNGLGDTGALGALGTGLAHYTGLTQLDLSRNRIVWRQGALAGWTSLRDLNLYENHLNEQSTVELDHDLASCTALTQLNLGRTNANSVAGMTSLVTGLQRCTGLTRLNLSHNLIGNNAVRILAEALPAFPGIVHLNLSQNEISFAGLDLLGAVLGACTSLESLDVGQNRIEAPLPAAVYGFTTALPRCLRLKHLDLSVNQLGVNVTGALLRVLPRCLLQQATAKQAPTSPRRLLLACSAAAPLAPQRRRALLRLGHGRPPQHSSTHQNTSVPH